MLLGLALAAAVAGGNLAVTISSHPTVGKRVGVYATGQVGERGGWLYIYRNTGRRCAVSVDGQRNLGSRARRMHAPYSITGSFAHRTSYIPRQSGDATWICAYLYAVTCDAAGNNCGPALGLPPDAGFSRVHVKVKARASQRSGSRAASP